MVIMDGLMSLYIKEVLIPDKVIEVVNRFCPIDVESEELPDEAEDAALFWMNKSCQKLKERIGEEVSTLTPTPDPGKGDQSRIPILDPLEYVWDLSDGRYLAALLTFYCPSSLDWKEICFNEPMSMADSIFNLQLVQIFCSSNMPCDIFFLSVEDFFDCHRVIRQNILAFVADLLYHFEIKPAECVQTPIADYNPLLSDEDNFMFNGRSHEHEKQFTSPGQQFMPSAAELKAMSLQHIAWDSDESAKPNGRRNSMTLTKKPSPARSSSHSYRRSISQEHQLDQFFDDDNEEELSRYFMAMEFDPRVTSSPESMRMQKREHQQRMNPNHRPGHHNNGHSSHHLLHQQQQQHQQQQHVPIGLSPSASERLDSRHASSPGVGFEIRADTTDFGSMSEISIARKKEQIMLQSIKRKAEQEARRIKVQEEQARKREEERKRMEEAERKREEERLKKQKILEEHRMQKAGGVWESEGPAVRQKSKWNIPPARQVSPARSASHSYVRSASRDNNTTSFANGSSGEEDMSRYFTALDLDPGVESSPESILLPKDNKKPLMQQRQQKQTPPSKGASDSETNGVTPRQKQVPIETSSVTETDATAGDDQSAHRPSTPGVGFVIEADVVDRSPVTEMTMLKKKELIMQQSIKRKAEQEARRIKLQEEQAQKREEERKRIEEAERKREEEKMRKQKILEEYRMKKAAEDEEKVGGSSSSLFPAGRDIKTGTVLLSRPNRGTRSAGSAGKVRPKSLHVNSSMMQDYLSLDPKVSKVTDSADSSSSCHFDSQPNNRSSHVTPAYSSSSIRTGNSDHSLLSSHENSHYMSTYSRTAVPMSSTGSSRPPSALSTSSRLLSSPPSTQCSVMPSMPPVFQRNRGPPSDGASDVGSTFSEYTGPKLFVKPTQKTNRGIILNAINIVLAGSVNSDLKKKVIEVSVFSPESCPIVSHLLFLSRKSEKVTANTS